MYLSERVDKVLWVHFWLIDSCDYYYKRAVQECNLMSFKADSVKCCASIQIKGGKWLFLLSGLDKHQSNSISIKIDNDYNKQDYGECALFYA